MEMEARVTEAYRPSFAFSSHTSFYTDATSLSSTECHEDKCVPFSNFDILKAAWPWGLRKRVARDWHGTHR
jgi:hypothetical protein